MQDIELFRQAFGLTSPWYVEETGFDPGARRFDLRLNFAAGGTFACPGCGRAGCKAHDTRERTWRHLDFFQYQACLHAPVPRVRCSSCGVKQAEVPWARPRSGFTLLFEALVLALAKEMPVRAVARIAGEHDTRLWRVVKHYADKARAGADYSGVRCAGMDEKAVRRGHNYITLFADLERHGGAAETVEELCTDMLPAYLKGAREEFPRPKSRSTGFTCRALSTGRWTRFAAGSRRNGRN